MIREIHPAAYDYMLTLNESTDDVDKMHEDYVIMIWEAHADIREGLENDYSNSMMLWQNDVVINEDGTQTLGPDYFGYINESYEEAMIRKQNKNPHVNVVRDKCTDGILLDNKIILENGESIYDDWVIDAAKHARFLYENSADDEFYNFVYSIIEDETLDIYQRCIFAGTSFHESGADILCLVSAIEYEKAAIEMDDDPEWVQFNEFGARHQKNYHITSMFRKAWFDDLNLKWSDLDPVIEHLVARGEDGKIDLPDSIRRLDWRYEGKSPNRGIRIVNKKIDATNKPALIFCYDKDRKVHKGNDKSHPTKAEIEQFIALVNNIEMWETKKKEKREKEEQEKKKREVHRHDK